MNSSKTKMDSNRQLSHDRTSQDYNSPHSIYYEQNIIKKPIKTNITQTSSEYNSPINTKSNCFSTPLSNIHSPIDQNRIQNKAIQQIQEYNVMSTPNSPDVQKKRSDFSTYALNKYSQLNQQSKAQSLNSSPIITKNTLQKKPINSKFIQYVSCQQKQLEKFIQKSQTSLTHFTDKNKETLNEKNIKVPNILSEPQNINYLFSDQHLEYESIPTNLQNNFQQNQLQNNSYFTSRGSYSCSRNQKQRNLSSLPSLQDNLLKSQPFAVTERNYDNQLSPIKKIFNPKNFRKSSLGSFQFTDQGFSNNESPTQQLSPSRKLYLKLQQKSNFQSSSPNQPQSTLATEIKQQQENKEYFQDEKPVSTRKKISWIDQNFKEARMKIKTQSKVFEDEQDNNQIENILNNQNKLQKNSTVNKFENKIPSQIIPKQRLSQTSQNSQLKSCEALSPSKISSQELFFKEQIRKQISQLEENPNETTIDRNFKKFKIIEDLQKLRIQDKLNKYKINNQVHQVDIAQQALKKYTNNKIYVSQSTVYSAGTLNNIQSINSSQNQNQNKQKINEVNQINSKISETEKKEITPEEEEQNTETINSSVNNQRNQMQVPPSLLNFECVANSMAMNDTEIIPSVESIEKVTISGFFKNALNINLQSLNQQPDEIDSPAQPQIRKISSQILPTLKLYASTENRQSNIINEHDLTKLSASPTTQTSQMELLHFNSFSQLEPKMMFRKHQTFSMKLKPTQQSQDMVNSSIHEIENLVKNHVNDTSFSTSTPRSSYNRKAQKQQSFRKSTFIQSVHTPINGRSKGRTMTINYRAPSTDHFSIIDKSFNESEIKVLNELSFFITDLLKRLKQDISNELKDEITHFCTKDMDQFIFSISQYVQYICTDHSENTKAPYICPFKLYPKLIEQILKMFVNQLTSLNQDEKNIEVFINAYNKHKQLIIANTILEKIGGQQQIQRLVNDVVEYQRKSSTNQMYEKLSKSDLIESQLKTLNIMLRSSKELIPENDWNEYKQYSSIDIFEIKKAFLTVMKRYNNLYDENFCYEFIELIEKCRDNLTHSLSIHRYSKDQKFMKVLYDELALMSIISKIGFNEKDIAIYQIIQYIFTPNLSSLQFKDSLQKIFIPVTGSFLKEMKEITGRLLRMDTEYNENLEYGFHFEYKFDKLNQLVNQNNLLQLGDLNTFFEVFNNWIDQQIDEKKNLGGFQSHEVKQTENFEALIKFYCNSNEVFNVKDVQSSLNLPVFEPERLVKFWFKGIKHAIMKHCQLDKQNAKNLRSEIANIITKSGGLQNSRRKLIQKSSNYLN